MSYFHIAKCDKCGNFTHFARKGGFRSLCIPCDLEASLTFKKVCVKCKKQIDWGKAVHLSIGPSPYCRKCGKNHA